MRSKLARSLRRIADRLEIRDYKLASKLGIPLRFYRPLKRLQEVPIRFVVDVGGHTGGFSKFCLTLFPDAVVSCFEPLVQLRPELESLARENKNFQPHLFALGATKGIATFYESEQTQSSSLKAMSDSHKFYWPRSASLKEQRVEVRRLDDLAFWDRFGYGWLLKIDVQGAELDVLRGAPISLRDYVAAIIIEVCFLDLYSGQPKIYDILGFLEPLGFEFRDIVHESRDALTGKLLYIDALLIKKAPPNSGGAFSETI